MRVSLVGFAALCGFFFDCPWVGIVLPACGNLGEIVIPQNPTQLSLSFDSDLAEQHRSLKECVAARVYQQRGGLTAVAGKLDMSPSHLSEVLAGGGERNHKFDLDELERYIEQYRDFTPILYLVAKFIPDQAVAQANALEQLAEFTQRFPEIVAQLGLAKRKRAA